MNEFKKKKKIKNKKKNILYVFSIIRKKNVFLI
jgi:hypothetical protein